MRIGNGSRMEMRLATLALLLAGLLLTACGSSGGGAGGTGATGPVYDPAASQALVDDGVAQLEQILASSTPPPFAVLADLSGKFNQAVQLDPNNPAAAFFGALGQIFLFLDSDAAKAFLLKLGWDDFRDHDDEFQGFVGSLVGSVGSIGGTGAFAPPVNTANGAITIGPGGNLTFADLIAFLTVTVPARLQTAVDLLGTIPQDFSISLTVNLASGTPAAQMIRMDTSGGNTVTIDYTDAMAVRAVFAGAETVFSAPGIWNYTGLDDFIAAHKDSQTGAVTFTNTDLQDYFNSAAQPLSNNAAGVDQVLSSLTTFSDSIDKAVLAQQTDTSNHLLSVSGLANQVSRYDDEPAVINYGLTAFRLTAADVKSALSTAGPVGVYQPVAFITDFGVCDPLGADELPPDTNPLHDATGPMLPLGSIQQLSPPTLALSLSTPVAQLASSAAPQGSDSAYYFAITLTGPADLSIWTDGADTHGTVGYSDSTAVVPWDQDENSGGNGNFGISIAAPYMADATMVGVAKGSYTFYVAVTSLTGDPFTLHVQTDLSGSWPAGQPIFLKGGGGRHFSASTYQIGAIDSVNLGNLVRVAGKLWDLSDRGSLIVDTAQTIPITQLNYQTADLRSAILSVLPGTTFSAPLDQDQSINVLSITGGISPPSYSLQNMLTDSNGPAFCAYPLDLLPARLFVGGYSVGIGF